MTSWIPNFGQYRHQSRYYASPDQDTPSPNTSAPDSQPQMDGLDGLSYHSPTDINGLAVSGNLQVPQTYQPAFDPPSSGLSAMQYPHQAGSHPAYQRPSGSGRTQQPLDRAAPTHSQPPNVQAHTSPTGFWNSSITAQIHPPSVLATYEPSPTSIISPTTGYSVGGSAHGPALFAMPNSPPLEVPQSINLSHFYDDAVHPSYRSIRLECFLKDPKGCPQNSKVIVRREKRVVLEMHLQADGGRMGWKGIALPRTGSVKQPNQQAPTRLLYFSIEVHGSTTGMSLTQPCDNCWRREMRPLGNPQDLPHYLIDFKSDCPFILFPRADSPPYTKAEVTFHFTCYSNHQKEDYELVARLQDEQGNLVAYCQVPYSFRSVAKPERDGGPQDDFSIPPVVSPVAAPVAPAAGPSTMAHPTTSTRRTVNASSHRSGPGGHHRASIRQPIPPLRPAFQRENVGPQPPLFGDSSRTDIQQQVEPLLQKVAPIEGPTRGGLNIVLIGTNFPLWPTIVYARFGSAVAATSWINPFTLECTLPTSPTSGVVDVTLSLSPDHNAPMLGRSLCTFTYREEQESFLLALRSIYSQGHELSRVALDILIPQLLRHASPETLNHTLRRLAQSQDGLPPIDDRELEELGVRFLATISDSPHWSNDLSFADENQQTIAHLCVLSGYTRLLTKIVDWGIDPDVQDVSGLTALHCAYLREDWDCVRILKEAGADEYIKDNLGRIPRRMCKYVEAEEDDWVDVSSRISTSPENVTLLGTQQRLKPHWRSPSVIKTDGGIRASPMPMPGPSSEGSSSADDDSWSTAFSNLRVTDSPPPITRAPSTAASSSSRRGGGALEASRYGWSHRTYPSSPPRVQRNTSCGVSAKPGSLPTTSSFSSMPAFPMPQPAVPSFPVPEPTGHAEESDDSADTQPSLQRSSPSPVSSPVSRHHTPAQTPLIHAPHASRLNLLAATRPTSSQSFQRSLQPSPSIPGTRYVPPPGPPPSNPVSSPGVVPNPQPHLTQFEKDEKAAIRHQYQEAMRTWPSAEKEKEKELTKFKMEQRTVTLERGALADPKAFTRDVKVAMDRFQQPKQGEA